MKGVSRQMKIERVDDKTVKCFLSNEDLEEYDLDYKDFIEHTDKAKEVVHEIIEQATVEVGYKPPQFAFDLQIMVVPEHGLVLTFYEREPGDKENSQLMECLREMRKMVQDAKAHSEESRKEAAASGKGEQESEQQKPEQAVFVFSSLRNVMNYAKILPANLRVDSVLYNYDAYYYLHLMKGHASYERYSRACIQALEYAALLTAQESRIQQMKEHGTCLIEEKALKKLRV